MPHNRTHPHRIRQLCFLSTRKKFFFFPSFFLLRSKRFRACRTNLLELKKISLSPSLIHRHYSGKFVINIFWQLFFVSFLSTRSKYFCEDFSAAQWMEEWKMEQKMNEYGHRAFFCCMQIDLGHTETRSVCVRARACVRNQFIYSDAARSVKQFFSRGNHDVKIKLRDCYLWAKVIQRINRGDDRHRMADSRIYGQIINSEGKASKIMLKIQK